jgi:CDGSH-type Zn-finger protein
MTDSEEAIVRIKAGVHALIKASGRTKTCLCGCGETVKPGCRFRIGHDGKLVHKAVQVQRSRVNVLEFSSLAQLYDAYENLPASLK